MHIALYSLCSHPAGIHTGFSARGGVGGNRGQGGVGSNCRVAFFRDLKKRL